MRALDAGLVPPVSDDLLRRLTPYGVEFRYDAAAMQLVTAAAATQAVDACLAWCAMHLNAAG